MPDTTPQAKACGDPLPTQSAAERWRMRLQSIANMAFALAA
jgi:hypothetical protein